MYNNPLMVRDAKLQIRVLAEDASAAAEYCERRGLEWAPAMLQRRHEYGAIRHTSHSLRMLRRKGDDDEVKQAECAEEDGAEELKFQEDVDAGDVRRMDEEAMAMVQKQRQRHQDRYIESMPSAYSRRTMSAHREVGDDKSRESGTVLSTVAVDMAVAVPETAAPRSALAYVENEHEQSSVATEHSCLCAAASATQCPTKPPLKSSLIAQHKAVSRASFANVVLFPQQYTNGLRPATQSKQVAHSGNKSKKQHAGSSAETSSKAARRKRRRKKTSTKAS